MKKIALLLTAFIGLTALQSCTIEEYYDENYYKKMQLIFYWLVVIILIH